MDPSTDSELTRLLSTYNYRNRVLAKRELSTALQHYRGLRFVPGKFTFNDGTQKDLVSLSGTIPVPFRGAQYNIPIQVWVLDTHPLHAPMCFVCPTPDMQIKVSRHVDHNGRVYLPYLHEWNESSSDLLGLIQICIITFGEQPPVFARSAGGGGPVVQPPQMQQQPPPYPPVSGGGGYGGGGQQQQQAISQDQIRASLLTAAEEKVKKMLREEFNTKQVEIESLRKVKEELNDSQRTAKNALQSMETESAKLEATIAELTGQKKSLEQLVQKASEDGADGDGNGDNVDESVLVNYPLHRQLFDAHVEDAAIEDSIYYLGEALRKEVLDVDTFLKNSRNISRKQFYLRLTIQKCLKKAERR